MSKRLMPVMAPIKINLHDQARAVITEFVSEEETLYRLTWDDYVINEWTEYFPTLAIALARVGMLSDAILNGTNMNDVEDFIALTNSFIGKTVS